MAEREAQGSDRLEARRDAVGELCRAQRELVQPRGVVDDDLQAAVGDALWPRVPRHVGTDEGAPGPTDPVCEETLAEFGHRADEQIGHGTRTFAFHDSVSYSPTRGSDQCDPQRCLRRGEPQCEPKRCLR